VVVAPEATQAQLDRILQSKNLRLSEVQRRLLLYLAERSLAGEADDLKEYTVGIDAFGKPPSYDPRQESVVRMHVARLRQKLAEYYRTDGADDPILVDLPKGGFKMTFEARPVAPEPPPPVVQPAPSPITKRSGVLLGSSLAALLIAGGLVAAKRFSATSAPELLASWTPELKQLWTPMLSRPIVVCIAAPSYGTASGAFRLGQFLGPHKTDLLVTPAEQLSMPEIAMDNVIFLGPATTNRQIQSLPVDQQLVLEPRGIRNLKPLPGEPAFISDVSAQDGHGAEESYALISHTPGLYGNGEVLYLAGNQVSSVTAAVKAFTDPSLARTLVDRMRSSAGVVPRYYQVILKVKSMDEMPVDISYVLHRELSTAK
jgi:hypothetical protein